MRNHKYNALALFFASAALWLVAACATSDSEEIAGAGSGEQGQARIAFSLGSTGTRAAAQEWQTASEKEIYNLYCLVFSGDPSTVTASLKRNNETGTETFQQCIKVYSDPVNPMPLDVKYIATVQQAGPAQILFIANASDAIVDYITGNGANAIATTTTLADLKAKVEEERALADGACYPMLMTSEDIYSKKLDPKHDAELGTVMMKRAAVRIDIVNHSSDYTITAVDFHNRTVKTPLFADGPDAFNAGAIEATHHYTTDIQPDPDCAAPYDDQHALLHTIYSYEQLAASAETAGVAGAGRSTYPSLTITYTNADKTKTYTHEVVFEKDGQRVDLMRNNLYRITMQQQDSYINFTITVKEWNEGEEFLVSYPAVKEGARRTTARVGDFYTQRGNIVPQAQAAAYGGTDADGNTDPIIGIVFSANSNPECEQFLKDHYAQLPDEAKKKIGNTTHGLVMRINSTQQWKHWVNSASIYYQTNTHLGTDDAGWRDSHQQEYIQGARTILNGYECTQALRSTNYSYAMWELDAYTNNPTAGVAKATNWYIPAIGEMWQLVLRLGCTDDDGVTHNALWDEWYNNIYATDKTNLSITGVMNQKLAKAGAGKYTAFRHGPHTSDNYECNYIWTSTEAGKGNVWRAALNWRPDSSRSTFTNDFWNAPKYQDEDTRTYNGPYVLGILAF